MEPEKKEPGIKLAFNEDLEEKACGFCGKYCKPDGLDFLIDGTKAFVCAGCVKEKAPELIEIHDDAHRWLEKKTSEAFHEGEEHGEQSGKEYAVKLIMRAINEPLETRLIRFCQTEILLNNPNEPGPFSEDDIPF